MLNPDNTRVVKPARHRVRDICMLAETIRKESIRDGGRSNGCGLANHSCKNHRHDAQAEARLQLTT